MREEASLEKKKKKNWTRKSVREIPGGIRESESQQPWGIAHKVPSSTDNVLSGLPSVSQLYSETFPAKIHLGRCWVVLKTTG